MLEAIYLVSRCRPSGPINQALNILTGMRQNGHVHAVLVTLAPEEKGNSWLQRFYENGIEVVQFGQPLKNTLRCVKMLENYVKEHHVQVIHSAGYRADFVSSRVKCEVKKVSTQRSHPREIAEKFPKLFRHIIENYHLQLIKKMDAIVACSLSLQDAFVNDFGVKGTLAVQNGVNTDKFHPVTKDRKMQIRQDLGMNNDKRIYLVLGSLRERKNVGLIIRSFDSIQNPTWELYIVGCGPDEEKLRAMTHNPQIVFTGNTDTPLLYLQAADVLVSSSLSEGLPNTVLEAMACGLPSVLSDIGPHIELHREDFLGKTFKSGSEKELTNIILESLNWNLEPMQKIIREYTENNFGLKGLATKYTEIYNQKQ